MVIDGHVHFDGPEFHDALMADMKRTGAEQFTVLIYEPQGKDAEAYRQAAGLWLKMKHWFQAYPFLRQTSGRRQKSYARSERLR